MWQFGLEKKKVANLLEFDLADFGPEVKVQGAEGPMKERGWVSNPLDGLMTDDMFSGT